MTASLYQRRSAAGMIVGDGRRRAVAVAVVTDRFSQVVLELCLAPEPRPDVQDRRGRCGRVELHAIPGPLPQVGRAVEEILRLVRARGIDPERSEEHTSELQS